MSILTLPVSIVKSPTIAPVPVARSVEVAPITKADLARSRMFGIKLPSIPLAPVFDPTESPVESNPRDSWPDWTDERWTIIEDEDFDALPLSADSETASGPTDSWMAEMVASNLTSMALGMIEDGETDEALGLYDATEPEFRAAFDTWILGLDLPSLDWLSWLNLCQAGSKVEFKSPVVARPASKFDAEGYRPTTFLGFIQTRPMEDQAMRILNNARPVVRKPDPAPHQPLRHAPHFGDIRDLPENAWHESELARARSSFGHPSYEG
jgi:hypothetical protein